MTLWSGSQVRPVGCERILSCSNAVSGNALIDDQKEYFEAGVDQ